MSATAVAPGPQLLDAEALALKSGGWYLPRGSSQWAPVTEHAPAAGARCWWSPTEPPGDGWGWTRQSSNI